MLQSSNEIADTKPIMQGDKSMKYATAFSFLFIFFIGLALPQVATASACLKKLNGTNGCFDSSGSCKAGFQYCLNEPKCKHNGGEMVNGICVARGTASGNRANSNSDSASACAAKHGTYDPEHFGS